jgi:hypothetical protein
MILPPHWTERNTNPETRGTAIVTIYRNGIPWKQRIVPVHDTPKPDQSTADMKSAKRCPKRRTDRRTARTAEQFVGELVADLVSQYFIKRTQKRR